MKTIGKYMAKKIASLLVLGLLLVGGFFWLKSQFPNWFAGTVTTQYQFVIKRFEKKSQLVVADAEVQTTVPKTFTNDKMQDWPKWTQKFTKILVGRDLVVDIPVKTEFKLQLEGVDENDVVIAENRLTFKKPLKVHVDSQSVGVPIIKSTSSGVVDKLVDAVTSSRKAQEFLLEKSQEAMYETSEHVLDDQGRQEKVAKFASQALENLLNLSSDEKLEVDLTVDDLEFVNIDKPE